MQGQKRETKNRNNARKQLPKNAKKQLKKTFQRELLKHLGLKKSIAVFLANLVFGIISSKSVWQKNIAQASDNNGSFVASFVRRTQRFLSSSLLSYALLSLMIYNQIGQKQVTIILDRTNWKRGNKNINIFVAAVLYELPGKKQATAIPIAWEVFDHAGNSDTQARIRLMKKVIQAVGGAQNIKMVLGDREFIGNDWIKFLHENNIPFIIRIKKMMRVHDGSREVSALELVCHVKQGEELCYDVMMNGIPVRLAATRSSENDLVVTIASLSVTDSILQEYRKRWLIELFFKSAKSQGFNLEDTHMTDPDHIKCLFGLITLATLFVTKAGIAKAHHVPIPIKNHGRPAVSIFTYGLDFVCELFRGTMPRWFESFRKSPTEKLPQGFFALESS